MNPFAELNLIERIAAWILHRSPRVTLLAVKHRDLDFIGWSFAFADEVAVQAVKQLSNLEAEPPSMTLERLYHAPSYGEDQ